MQCIIETWESKDWNILYHFPGTWYNAGTEVNDMESYTAYTRSTWLNWMKTIVSPVISSLSEGKLHSTLPSDFHPDRKPYAMLEAFGRTMEGIAPFLELEGTEGEEKAYQDKLRRAVIKGLAQAVDPAAPDHMNFSEGYGQSLVDAAFLAHGVVRAPKQLGEKLDGTLRDRLILALRSTRTLTPFVSNWILFSAMVEAALKVLGDQPDMTRVDYAVQMFRRWYVGDGTYGDGDRFHWDYYNSFVIQPMLVDVLRVFEKDGRDYGTFLEEAIRRSSRYSHVLEEMVGPDGSWCVYGRSTVYRFGCFQLLSQAALQHFLPEELKAGQVRAALSACIDRSLSAPGTFDEKGFLTPGVCGHQPSMAEEYISTGSLYLCAAVFLPLGLPSSDPFWTEKDQAWTSRKIWCGEDVMRDHAVD